MKRKQSLVLSRSTQLVIALGLMLISRQFQTDAKPLCQGPGQVVLKTAINSSFYICAPCISHCPSGWEPSIPCGGSGISQTCELCPEKSYKEKHDGSQCIPCTVCGQGYDTLRNCSREKNSICSKICKRGFYKQDTLDACLPCSRCCFDGNDKVVDGCRNQGMAPSLQCEEGNARCQQSVTTTLPSTSTSATTTTTKTTTTAAATTTTTTTKRAGTQTTEKSAQNILSKRKKKAEHARPTVQDIFSAINTTKDSASVSAVSQNSLDKRQNQNTEGSGDLSGEKVLILIILLSVLVIVVLVLVLVLVLLYRKKRQSNAPLMENGHIGGSSETRQPEFSGESPEDIELQNAGVAEKEKLLEQKETSTTVHTETKRAVVPLDTHKEFKMTLVQLKERHLDVFDKVCKSLNTSLHKRPRGDFAQIAFLHKMDSDDIRDLERDEQPGRKVMEFLEAKEPELTVETFIQDLKHIKRKDIIKKLENFIYVSRSEDC